MKTAAVRLTGLFYLILCIPLCTFVPFVKRISMNHVCHCYSITCITITITNSSALVSATNYLVISLIVLLPRQSVVATSLGKKEKKRRKCKVRALCAERVCYRKNRQKE